MTRGVASLELTQVCRRYFSTRKQHAIDVQEGANRPWLSPRELLVRDGLIQVSKTEEVVGPEHHLIALWVTARGSFHQPPVHR